MQCRGTLGIKATPDSVRVLLKRGLGFKPAECWEWSPGAGTLSALCASPSPEKGLGPLLNVHLPGHCSSDSLVLCLWEDVFS